MAKVTIIIPVFNQAALTDRCLRAVQCEGVEIVVVDDASTDETPGRLEGFRSQIKVVTHAANQGFAASCNDGARVATGAYLVFLNNDTVPEPGWLEALVDYADACPRASVVGSRLVYPDRTIQHAGVVICQDRYPRHIYTGFPGDHPAVTRSRRFQIVTAACMLVRRDAFAEANGFDPAFRNGFEDVDFCLRLGESGHQVHYCAASVVEHLESVAAGRFKHDRDNVALYRERWFTRAEPDDLRYYVEDGLLQLTYEGSFPIGISVSPRLAILEKGGRNVASEQLLADQARQIADLRRENARRAAQVMSASSASEAADYDRLRRRIRHAVERAIPLGATVLVVSKGDRALLELRGRRGWHFPRTANGTYAGYHPADSTSALAQLEALRAQGAEYLLIPKTAFWWLEHYREFGRYLRLQCRVLVQDQEACFVFQLNPIVNEPLPTDAERLPVAQSHSPGAPEPFINPA